MTRQVVRKKKHQKVSSRSQKTRSAPPQSHLSLPNPQPLKRTLRTSKMPSKPSQKEQKKEIYSWTSSGSPLSNHIRISRKTPTPTKSSSCTCKTWCPSPKTSYASEAEIEWTWCRSSSASLNSTRGQSVSTTRTGARDHWTRPCGRSSCKNNLKYLQTRSEVNKHISNECIRHFSWF